MLAANALGDKLISARWTALLTMLVAMAGSLLPGLSGVLGAVSSVLTPILLAIWIEGDVLAYVLPMTPYLVWFGVIAARMIAVIEAFFAAPLWFMVHTHPEGNDMAGKGGSGYMLLFSLAFRPALVVVGLIAAFVVMSVLGGILNLSFRSAVAMAAGNIDLVGVVAILFLYISLMMVVVKTSIGLVHVIPDKIFQWIGGYGGDLGQTAGQTAAVGDDAGRKTQTAILGAGQAMGNARRGYAEGVKMASDRKEEKARPQKEAAAAQEKETAEEKKVAAAKLKESHRLEWLLAIKNKGKE